MRITEKIAKSFVFESFFLPSYPKKSSKIAQKLHRKRREPENIVSLVFLGPIPGIFPMQTAFISSQKPIGQYLH